MSAKSPTTACVVTCYKQPDYVRAVTLARGLADSEIFDRVVAVRNRRTGVMRYMEFLWQLIKTRITINPDVYVITFRGYEILPIVLLFAIGKTVVYDEMINPVEWFVYEHKKFGERSVPAKILRVIYRFLGNRANAIITDTQSHADYSAALMNLPTNKYAAIPVSTDEVMFAPQNHTSNDIFTVLYCGNMKPLYGVEYVIDAAIQLKDRHDIIFHIVGGDKKLAQAIERATGQGAHIIYDAWVPYADFPAMFHASDLCLGGPFGKTVQSAFVVTGKTYQFLAAGLPTVIGDNHESHQFNNKTDVLIVPQADAMAIKSTVEWAADHPAKLAQIAQNGRKLYEREFSSKRVASDLGRLFTKQLAFDMKTGRYDQQRQQKHNVKRAVDYTGGND